MKTKIGIIGGGNMGAAILAGIRKGYSVNVCEEDKKRSQFLKRKFKLRTKNLKEVVSQSRIIILAVKPQDFDGVLKELKPLLTQNQLIVSIAAGVTTQYIEKRLKKGVRIVRAMPNLPAQAREGITAMCKSKAAMATDIRLAHRVFECIGPAYIVQEKWMDAVTAVSGSGPAYVFLFVECFQKAAQSLGLKGQIGSKLVMQTLRGSVKLLESQNLSAGEWRMRVTSKGGTTQAAMDVFTKRKLEKIFKEALQAAARRAKQLAK